MRYSVIIPVYNAEKTLKRCVDSLIKQNYKDMEIILVNDGSTDSSLSICKEYEKNEYIRVINQKNSGVAAARNSAIEVARGMYITFVDSDDYVMDKYFLVLDSFEEDLVMFSYMKKRGETWISKDYNSDLLEAKEHSERLLNIIGSREAAPWNKRFKKGIIDKYQIRFKTDLSIGEDFIFGLEYLVHSSSSIIVKNKLYCVDESNSESITRAPKYDFTQFIEIYKYAFKIVENESMDNNTKNRLLSQLDYLYCRTVFAAEENLIKSEEKRNMTTSKLVRMFRECYQWNYGAINCTHKLMRFCINYQWVLVIFVVAKAHLLGSKMHNQK